jgi:hypothetical protein
MTASIGASDEMLCVALGLMELVGRRRLLRQVFSLDNRREGKSARQSITHKNKTPLVRGLAVQRAGRRGIGGIGADPSAPSDC